MGHSQIVIDPYSLDKKEVRMFARHRRILGLTIATLSGGVVLCAGLPGRAQQPLPSVPAARHTVPATITAGRSTSVPVEFDLPAGFSLVGFPRLRVVDSKGKTVEMKPTYISQKPPAGRGLRVLQTDRYRRGAYQVRLEVAFRDRAGKAGTIASPWSALVVP